MPAMLGFFFTLLLGSAFAQQFPDYLFDYDIEGYTAECKAALNETLQCSSLLASIESEGIELSKDDVTELCTSECRCSLAERQQTIQKACLISTNTVNGDTAQDNINIFLDTFTKTCFTDPKTKDFYYNIMQLWPVAENMTAEQNCSDCNIGLLQLDLSSEFSYDDEVAARFSSLTESCCKTGFEPKVPTGVDTNFTATATPSTTPTQDCIATHIIQEDDTCNGICRMYNVSTEALTYTNELPAYCRKLPKPGTKLCIPYECDIYTVDSKDTCWTVVKKFGGVFSVSQLISWNPALNKLCTNML